MNIVVAEDLYPGRWKATSLSHCRRYAGPLAHLMDAGRPDFGEARNVGAVFWYAEVVEAGAELPWKWRGVVKLTESLSPRSPSYAGYNKKAPERLF